MFYFQICFSPSLSLSLCCMFVCVEVYVFIVWLVFLTQLLNGFRWVVEISYPQLFTMNAVELAYKFEEKS